MMQNLLSCEDNFLQRPDHSRCLRSHQKMSIFTRHPDLDAIAAKVCNGHSYRFVNSYFARAKALEFSPPIHPVRHNQPRQVRLHRPRIPIQIESLAQFHLRHQQKDRHNGPPGQMAVTGPVL